MSKVVLGGGISGLSAAYYLQKRFPLQKITVIEASSRLGGWIKSTESKEGYIFEQGPRTIRPSGLKGHNTLQLIEELQLEQQIQPILSTQPAALNRMIYTNNKLHSLPSNLLSIFKTQSPFTKPLIFHLLNDLKAPKQILLEHDESIYSFVKRRFGKEVADYAISPLICGICAGNAKEISVKFLMENLFDNEQKYGSVIKGMFYNMFGKNKSKAKNVNSSLLDKVKREKWSMYSFKGGLETLTKSLEQINRQNGVNFLLNTVCTEVRINNGVVLHLNNGSEIITDHLISCISANKLGNILRGHSKLTKLLLSIPYVNVCVINLHYNRKLINKEAFGFLIPPKENLPILGVIYDSCCFPHNDDTILTVMMGGYWFQNYFGDNPSDQQLLAIALDQLKVILDINDTPTMYQINVLHNCIPQYTIGHNKKIDQIHNYIDDNNLPLSVCGSSYKGVGINDVIFNAKMVINELTQ